MESFFLQYRSSTIHYSKAGNGSKLLFCFHGYSQSALSFSFLEKELSADFIMIAIDFPFHGKTIWKEGLTFKPEMLLEILTQIKTSLPIKIEKLSLMGFSMGGRAALSLMPAMAKQMEKMVLIAPDGLKLNFWYWLATQNKLGNHFFKYIMQQPTPMFKVLQLLNKMGMVNQSIYKFISFYIYDKQVRDDLYKRWSTMRKFRPHIKKIKSLIYENQIPIRMLYGEHDRIIRYERAEKFRKGIEAYSELKIIPSGHLLLTEANAAIIKDLLKN